MPLVDVAEFRLQVGEGDTPAADLAFVTAATAAVKAYLRWNPERATQTKYLDGTGTPELVLPGFPADPAVTEVRLDRAGGYGQVPDTFGTDTILTAGEGYVFDAAAGVLRAWRVPPGVFAGWPGYGAGPGLQWGGLTTGGRRAAYWPRVPGCVKVTWANGYSLATAPEDMKAAVIQIAAWLRNTQEMGGLQVGSVSHIDVSASVQAASDALEGGTAPGLGTARMLLANYREPVVAGGIR